MEKKRRGLVVGFAVFLCFSVIIGVAADGITIYLPLVMTEWISSPPPTTETVIYLDDPIVVEGSGAVVSGNSVTIVDGGAYRVVGVLADGLLDVNTTGAVELILDGASITHAQGPAIYVTNAAELSVVLAGGTLNTLTDGASYSDTKLKGALHSNDPLVISGAGALVVTGYYKHGIVGDDNIIIEGGDISIAATSDGIHANDDITVSDGMIHITQANDGMESEGTLLIEGGALVVTAQDDGIISQDTLIVSGGSIEIVSAVEGLESKNNIIINDGALNIEVSDDGLNATNDITINGGQIYINATGDAVDSNGTLNINGGLMVALGGQMPEGGLDCDRCFIKFTGGTVVATGGDNSVPAHASTQQVLVIGSRPTDSVLNIDPSGTGTAVLNFRISKAYDQMIFSSPDLAAYTTYTANSGGSLSGGADFYGLYTGATHSGGSEWVTFTTDSVITYVGIP